MELGKKQGRLVLPAVPIACEAVCSRLVNIEPNDMPIIKTARQMDFGCKDFDRIEIKGDDLTRNICTDFEPAELIPIRFSLLHVCRSIAKQGVFLTKSAIKKHIREVFLELWYSLKFR